MRRRFLVLLAAMLLLNVGGALHGIPGGAAPVHTVAPSPLSVAGKERFVIIPGESTVAYRVGETLLTQNTRWRAVVGVTSAIHGEMLVDRVHPAESRLGPVTVDVGQLKSDSDRRDSALRTRWLESAQYPIAAFAPTAISGLPAAYVEGRDISALITGNLTIRDVTRPATFAATLTLEGNTLRGVADTIVRMTDFGFEPPSLLGIVRVENEVALEVRLRAQLVP